MGEKAKRKKAERKARKSAKAAGPREVGGITVPKELREAGTRLVAAAESPAGREVIAAGVSIVAAVAQAAVVARTRKPKAEGEAIGEPARGSPLAGAAAAAMIGTMAETLLAKVLTPKKG